MKILALATVVSLSSLIIAIGLLLPTESKACTCVVQPLAQRYERASVVFVARVEKRSDQLDELGISTAEWPFEIDEVLKGVVTFDVLIPGGCGWGAVPGEQYLLFADQNGAVGTCTAGRLNQSDRYRADLEVLRQYRDGDLQSVREPLVLSTVVDKCRLALKMAVGHGSLIFDYRFADADARGLDNQQFRYDITTHRTITLEDAGPHPAYFAGFKRLKIWYPHSRYKIDGSGRLRIGDKVWTTEYRNMEAPFRPFEVVSDTGFGEVLAALKSNDRVQIAAEYRDFPQSRINYPDFPKIEGLAPHFYRGTSVDQFQWCIDLAGQ